MSSSSGLFFTHATLPDARITCYPVGSYSFMPSQPEVPIMRCFLSGGMNAGVAGTEIPLGVYNSEQGGLSIVCDSMADSRMCSIRRSEASLVELPGNAAFLVDCAAAMGKPECPAIEPARVENALTASDPMIRDSVTVGDAQISTRVDPAIGASDVSHMTCMHMLARRPVEVTVYGSGPVGMGRSG
jgi:hypothetical protein